MAKQVLEQFQQHPESWKRVDGILENSTLIESKVSPLNTLFSCNKQFIALQILEKLIKTMWKVLPPVQRQGGCLLFTMTKKIGIKNFIVAVIIKTSSEQELLEKNKTLLGKLNIVLVQVCWVSNDENNTSDSKTRLAS